MLEPGIHSVSVAEYEMEYEVADKLVSSDNEMVRDVVVEEVTDTLSPSGEENIVIGGNHTDLYTNTRVTMSAILMFTY